jgi:hypothetical protein
MTYSSGSLILASDYNTFVGDTTSGLNRVWSTGSSDYGYGQTTISQVSAAGVVTATNWATLVNNLATTASHQNTTITSRTAPTTGNVIAILSNMSTDITAVTNARGNAVGTGSQITTFTGTAAKTTSTGSGSSAWTITFTHTVTFASANAARYFFNAGGRIKWQVSKTSTGQVADPEWNDLASNLCGAIFITGGTSTQTIAGSAYTGTTKSGGTGTPTILDTTTGWYDLLTTPTIVYKQFADTAPYTGQYIQLQLQVNTSIASATVLTLTTTWYDPGGSGVGSSDVISGGTTTSSPFSTFGTAPATIVTAFPPSTTYLTDSWGTPTIAASVA